jgi:hypothetical protein
VDVDDVADAGVQHREDVGLSLVHEPDVADEGFVEDRVDLRAVVHGPLGGAPHADPGAGGGGRHGRERRTSLVL